MPEFQTFSKLVFNQPTLNNETYDATDDGVIELTTALCKKDKILRILTGYVCSDFETWRSNTIEVILEGIIGP